MGSPIDRGRWLLAYALLSYVALLTNASLLARSLSEVGAAGTLFFAAALTDSCALYLLVVLLPVAFAHFLVRWIERRRARQRIAHALVLALAVVSTAALQIAVYADRRIFELFGFHLNGFVLNLVTTPGGVDSMGGDEATSFYFGAVALALVSLQAALLALAWRAITTCEARARPPRRVLWCAALGAMALITVSERFGYAISHLRGYAPVLDAADALPYYEPVTISHIAHRLGLHPERDHAPRFRVSSERLAYPLAPVARGEHRPLNIVWLVAESLRADMLDPQIMPRTHAFAERALWFRQHYSGGNGTRMGMFSMFYGLPGTYWFPFLQHRRQPVLLDVLQQDGYQLGLFTSANFTYPEFDQTIFASVPAAQLHAGHPGVGWKSDRRNVGELLDFIERRDPARPFMVFLFFESPHARYYFPPESVIRQPYLEDLSYATMDLQRDIGKIFNRYVNACHHLDSQFARVLEYLEAHRLLDSTLVVVTGDHGEEFLEKGRWGHGSAFSEEQTRVPLVLWIPGESHREVTTMTSHVDIPPTVLARLGVANPPQDYSIGQDLLGGRERTSTVLADWNHLVWVDGDAKLIFPMKAVGFLQRRRATTRDDALLSASATRALLERKRKELLEVMHDLVRFSGRG